MIYSLYSSKLSDTIIIIKPKQQCCGDEEKWSQFNTIKRLQMEIE
jgi:hypothetical protein